MDAIETVMIQCPHCWEMIEHRVDCTLAAQQYVEDCSVCCQPITLQIAINHHNEISVEVWKD